MFTSHHVERVEKVHFPLVYHLESLLIFIQGKMFVREKGEGWPFPTTGLSFPKYLPSLLWSPCLEHGSCAKSPDRIHHRYSER